MRGFPKNLNTKFDYEYVLENFTDIEENRNRVIMEFKALLASVQGWFFEKTLKSEAEGINDETHKVVVSEANQPDTETTYSQYILKDNSSAKLFNIGYTKKQVLDIIDSLENK